MRKTPETKSKGVLFVITVPWRSMVVSYSRRLVIAFKLQLLNAVGMHYVDACFSLCFVDVFFSLCFVDVCFSLCFVDVFFIACVLLMFVLACVLLMFVLACVLLMFVLACVLFVFMLCETCCGVFFANVAEQISHA